MAAIDPAELQDLSRPWAASTKAFPNFKEQWKFAGMAQPDERENEVVKIH